MKNEQPEMPQPAAYDAEGRPLYYQEPAAQASQPDTLVTSKPESYDGHNFNPRIRTQYANEPDLVHTKREIEPKVSVVSDKLKAKHDECMRLYPYLNLSEGEYVVLRISRHPIGLLIPAFSTALAIVVFTTFALLIPDLYSSPQTSALYTDSVISPTPMLMASVLLLLAVLSALLGGITIWVYQRNRFFLTNESVIQEIQHSLFSRHEQTVSLGSIEDASFTRRGILQHLFNYGTMRLSTEGEETTYSFAYVEDPKRQIATINNAIEAFKNGRPVGDED